MIVTGVGLCALVAGGGGRIPTSASAISKTDPN